MIPLTRRLVCLMPLLVLAGCGDDEATEQAYFAPLRYGYLPPIQLNAATIEVQQRFIPAGVSPDVSRSDPASPVDALREMAGDRLQAFGTANKAVFAILDASMTQVNDVIRGSMTVSLTIDDNDGTQRGFAEAHVDRSHTGRVDDLRQTLYDMTRGMMDDMNVEFEYQVRKNLKDWLVAPAAPDQPVQQTPLDQPSSPQMPAPQPSLPPPSVPQPSAP